MNEELESLDANREKIIKELREVQKLSKAAIYSLQRGSFEDARTKLATAERLALSYLPLITQFQVLRKGTFSSAIEEFVEARAFEFFLLHGKLIPMADLGGIPGSIPQKERRHFCTDCFCFKIQKNIWVALRICAEK